MLQNHIIENLEPKHINKLSEILKYQSSWTMDIPANFICPITKNVMKNPVMSRYASYEKSAILARFEEGEMTCPVTGEPLYPSSIISNVKLQKEIEYWMNDQNGEGKANHPETTEPTFFATALLPPSHFYCPLTKKIMNYPVVTRDGLNFEREAIIDLLEKNSCTCPISGKSLFPHDLIPNYKLQKDIEEWHRINKDGAPTEHHTIQASAIFFETMLNDVANGSNQINTDGTSTALADEKQDKHFSVASKIRHVFFRKPTQQEPKMQQRVAKSA